VDIADDLHTSLDLWTGRAEDEIEAAPVIVDAFLNDNCPWRDVLLDHCAHQLLLSLLVQGVELQIRDGSELVVELLLLEHVVAHRDCAPGPHFFGLDRGGAWSWGRVLSDIGELRKGDVTNRDHNVCEPILDLFIVISCEPISNLLFLCRIQ
jgi:hypothetical protein